MYNVFIDGKEGTTGLQIYDRLAARSDINLITLPEELRKDRDARRECLNRADISFLCLPDAAAVEAVSLVENERSRMIDASTAHRTSPGWVYGFAELSAKKRAEIAAADRVANPGCYATGFISLVAPLVAGGIASPEYPFVCHALSGYSGAGKKGIAQYLSPERDRELDSPRHYALGQRHKHLPEMTAVTGLSTPPAFCPVVGDFYSGMEVTVPLFARDLEGGASAEDVKDVYRALYDGSIVFYREGCDEGGFLSAAAYSGKDGMEISVHGNEDRILLVARYDNLGKGASGAAVECMNISLGSPPERGLEL